jgi:hypothetical protein
MISPLDIATLGYLNRPLAMATDGFIVSLQVPEFVPSLARVSIPPPSPTTGRPSAQLAALVSSRKIAASIRMRRIEATILPETRLEMVLNDLARTSSLVDRVELPTAIGELNRRFLLASKNPPALIESTNRIIVIEPDTRTGKPGDKDGAVELIEDGVTKTPKKDKPAKVT